MTLAQWKKGRATPAPNQINHYTKDSKLWSTNSRLLANAVVRARTETPPRAMARLLPVVF